MVPDDVARGDVASHLVVDEVPLEAAAVAVGVAVDVAVRQGVVILAVPVDVTFGGAVVVDVLSNSSFSSARRLKVEFHSHLFAFTMMMR